MNSQSSPRRRATRNFSHCAQKAPFRPPFGVLRQRGGFSLVEVVIALGVVAFAFVALFGMLPVGLNAFNNSIDSTIETQIAESVISQLKQAKFSQLYTEFNDVNQGMNATPAGGPSFYKPYSQQYQKPAVGYFYDDQGNFLGLQTTTTTLSGSAMQKYIYSAAVQVYYDSWSISSGTAATPPYNTQPTNPSNTVVSTTLNTQAQQPLATVVITISKLSSPNVARIYTGYIDNNGL